MKMVRLRLNNCDEINHAGVKYSVSNSGRHLGLNEVLVPQEVADVVLGLSVGATRVEESEPELTKCPTCGHLRKE